MKGFRSIFSGAFAVLVLFSSSSFMVGIHLCSGRIQNVALFTKAESCEMEKKIPPCHRHESKPCCEDETIIHNSEDFNTRFTDFSIAPALASDVELPPVLISEVIPASPILNIQSFNYDPPLRASDLTVSFRVFLI
jgi:hypothetical protein